MLSAARFCRQNLRAWQGVGQGGRGGRWGREGARQGGSQGSKEAKKQASREAGRRRVVWLGKLRIKISREFCAFSSEISPPESASGKE